MGLIVNIVYMAVPLSWGSSSARHIWVQNLNALMALLLWLKFSEQPPHSEKHIDVRRCGTFVCTFILEEHTKNVSMWTHARPQIYYYSTASYLRFGEVLHNVAPPAFLLFWYQTRLLPPPITQIRCNAVMKQDAKQDGYLLTVRYAIRYYLCVLLLLWIHARTFQKLMMLILGGPKFLGDGSFLL